EAAPKKEAAPAKKEEAEVKITTVKITANDKDDSDSDGDDTPVVPVRKVVKIDETLLKELPEVPKKRGGRNLNKFRK
ncbi:hypothetical protein BGZ97_008964, partial [Linnemannia gamsii]